MNRSRTHIHPSEQPFYQQLGPVGPANRNLDSTILVREPSLARSPARVETKGLRLSKLGFSELIWTSLRHAVPVAPGRGHTHCATYTCCILAGMRGRAVRNVARVMAALLACAGIPAFAGNGWQSIQFEPPGIVLQGPGASQKFIITARDDRAHEADVTRSARLTSSDPQVVSVDPGKGAIVGLAPGKATVEISFGDLTTSVPIEVRNQSREMTVSFSRDVMSILTTKGCNSSACHGSPAGQNGFKLSLFGYDVAADHKMVVAEHDGRRVDFDNPKDSLLLTETLVRSRARRRPAHDTRVRRLPNAVHLARTTSAAR